VRYLLIFIFLLLIPGLGKAGWMNTTDFTNGTYFNTTSRNSLLILNDTLIFEDYFDSSSIDTSKWHYYSIEPNISSGYLEIINGANLIYNTGLDRPKTMEFRAKWLNADRYVQTGFMLDQQYVQDQDKSILGSIDTGNFRAESYEAGSGQGTNIDNTYLGSFHTYRIEWSSSASNFYVNGLQVASLAARVPSITLYPAFKYNSTDSLNNLTVDWVRVWDDATSTPIHQESGYFLSNTTATARDIISVKPTWGYTKPATGSLSLEVTADGTHWYNITGYNQSTFSIPGEGQGKSLQYRINISTTNTSETPEVDYLYLEYTEKIIDAVLEIKCDGQFCNQTTYTEGDVTNLNLYINRSGTVEINGTAGFVLYNKNTSAVEVEWTREVTTPFYNITTKTLPRGFYVARLNFTYNNGTQNITENVSEEFVIKGFRITLSLDSNTYYPESNITVEMNASDQYGPMELYNSTNFATYATITDDHGNTYTYFDFQQPYNGTYTFKIPAPDDAGTYTLYINATDPKDTTQWDRESSSFQLQTHTLTIKVRRTGTAIIPTDPETRTTTSSSTSYQSSALTNNYICAQNPYLSALIQYKDYLYEVGTDQGIYMNNQLHNGTIYIPITKGGCDSLKDRIDMFEDNSIFDQINPSVSYGFKEKQEVFVGLNYDSIYIYGSADVRSGRYNLILRNNGTDSQGRILITAYLK